MNQHQITQSTAISVSMKSGLEDRNNVLLACQTAFVHGRLNEVRPGRPEQFAAWLHALREAKKVSMKSGLEDRNNTRRLTPLSPYPSGSQ